MLFLNKRVKFARLCLDNFSEHEQLTPVNDSFRIIILTDRKFINEVDIVFLNRLEKMILNREMYNEKRAKLRQSLKEKANKKIFIPKMKINWDLYKMKKFNKINININIKNDEKKENENDLLCY